MKSGETNRCQILDDVGRRIREARVLAGLTQEELAGGDITRNMLSRIENGAALPSLPTLCALADRLGIPAGAFLGDLDEYNSYKLKVELQALLVKKKYQQMIERCKSSGQKLDDELRGLLYEAYVKNALDKYLSAGLEKRRLCSTKPSAARQTTAPTRRRPPERQCCCECCSTRRRAYRAFPTAPSHIKSRTT